MKKYLKNNQSGVIFPATTQLLKDRAGLGLSLVTEEEYQAQEGGLVESYQEPVSTEIDPNRMTLLVEAIARLDPNNPDHFSEKTGLPNAREMSKLVEGVVSSEERDAAWELYKGEE